MLTHFFKTGTIFFSFLVYTIIFSIFLSSCTTTSSHRIDSNILRDADLKIDNAEYLVMKDGSFVSLEGRIVWLKRTYKEFSNVLVVTGGIASETINGADSKDYIIKYKEDVYLLDSVKELYVTKTEADPTGTVMLVVGSVLGAALFVVILAAIEFSNHPPHSCPFIYSFDGEKYVMDAEPLGGAVCEGLERTDVSKLENLKEVDGNFKVRVRNANDEQQKIDKLDFARVSRGKNEFTATDNAGKFYRYKNRLTSISAVNESGTDISGFIAGCDGIKWFNDLPSDPSGLNYTPKETLTFRFPKPEGAKNALLIINGGASYFGSGMIPEMLKLNGNKVDEVYNSIYPGSETQKKLFSAMHRDESYYMDIKTLNGKELNNQGIMKSNGPVSVEDVIYPLNLENIESGYIEIVLTPQRYFWKFDMINITYDYEEVSEKDVSKLEVLSVRDNSGENLIEILDKQDKNYCTMPVTGDFADILLKVPAGYDPEYSDIYVSTTGWYEINLKKNTGRDENQVGRILYSPNGLFEYAVEKYKNELAGLTAALKFK